MIYLDANASEPLRPEAREAVVAALRQAGNPSSVHQAGRAARRWLEDAREAIAQRFGADPARLVFTSGGTEANVTAIHMLAGPVGGRQRRVLVGATEHDAVRAAAPDGSVLPVLPDGTVDLAALSRALREGGPALVCLMPANNETGVLHPWPDIVALCREHGAWLHADAVQAAGRVGFDFAASGADSAALSAHKLGGPAGAGALLLSPETAAAAAPLIAGGGQEQGRRGGTPAWPAIAGFTAAVQAMRPEAEARRLAGLRNAAEAAAVACGALVVGGGERLANTTCLALPGVAALTQVIALDLAGVAVSAGAACSSGKVARSHVLEAMGVGALAGEAIRVSLPWNATEADVAGFAHAYRAVVARVAGRAA